MEEWLVLSFATTIGVTEVHMKRGNCCLSRTRAECRLGIADCDAQSGVRLGGADPRLGDALCPSHPIAVSQRASNKGCLPLTFTEYLQLLEWTGRQVREDKRGAIPDDLAPVFERLNLSDDGWLNLVCDFRRKFRRAAGTPASLSKEAAKRGCQKMHGIVHSRAIFDRQRPSSA